MWLAGLFCAANAVFIAFGLYGLKYTGYGFDYLSQEYADFLAGVEGAAPSPTEKVPDIIIVGLLALFLGIAGYIIAQRQWGKPLRLRDPSDEQPTQEAIEGEAARTPTSAPAVVS